MAIFRVSGYNAQGEVASIVVEAASEAVARSEAVRQGLVNTTRVDVLSIAPDEDAVVRVPRPTHATRRPAAYDPLRDAPVWTIAKGVFLGLLLWAIFVFALWLMFVIFVGGLLLGTR
ncbi:MAG: hypothetical protein RBS39_00715 [Phycisphaerales bacterium]|jgi:hypothetical protein|nr:hypothetical protein [Phycisphaerales bacterium]